MIFGVGADSGASAAWALVGGEPDRMCHLYALEQVHGTRDELWCDRARAGAMAMHERAPNAVWWVERPPARIRRDAGMAHHNVGVSLGVRIGILCAEAYRASGRWPVECEPGDAKPSALALDRSLPPAKRHHSGRSQWWWYLHPVLHLRPKTDSGEERIAQAARAVVGAKEALALVPAGRRVDCAESILIAAACTIASIREQAHSTRRTA